MAQNSRKSSSSVERSVTSEKITAPESSTTNNVSSSGDSLSDTQKARIERNRQKALNLKAAKLISHPYAKSVIDAAGQTTVKVQGTKYIDSGGGFLIEQSQYPNKTNDNNLNDEPIEVIDEAIELPVTYEKCIDCEQQYTESNLMNNFGYSVCDACYDPDEKHSYITRTEAKSEYLLKDCDLDKREPPLRFITRKNPHNIYWGDMKLYLHLQVEERALVVHGSEEQLSEEHKLRNVKREKTKLKKYNKNLTQLRKEMRSSLFDRTSAGPHKHTFGDETYNEDDDNYTQICTECGFNQTYEKM